MATRYLAKLNDVCTPDSKMSSSADTLRQWMAFLNASDPAMAAGIRRGDVLENVDQSGVGAAGMYFFDVDQATHSLILCNADYKWDGHGYIPESVEIITQFPNPRHWWRFRNKPNQSDVRCFPGTNVHDAKAVLLSGRVRLPLHALKSNLHWRSESEIEIVYGGFMYTVRNIYKDEFRDDSDDSDLFSSFDHCFAAPLDVTWVPHGARWSFSPVLCFV